MPLLLPVESIGAITLSVLALVAPVVAIDLVATLLVVTLTKFFQSRAILTRQ